MKLKNTPTKDGSSYEKPKPGKYLGVLIGVANLGIQPGNGQYKPSQQLMLRWELHKRRKGVVYPSNDSKDFIHTVTSSFGATVRGENSRLRKALQSHGIEVPENGETDSREWLGKAAWLDIELSSDERYANITQLSRLDPDDDETPERVLPTENWDGEPSEGDCPSWAAWAVSKSTDLSARAPGWSGGKKIGGSRDEDEDDAPTPAPTRRPPAAEAVTANGDDDDDDIPF